MKKVVFCFNIDFNLILVSYLKEILDMLIFENTEVPQGKTSFINFYGTLSNFK